jgi:hypothetical protein
VTAFPSSASSIIVTYDNASTLRFAINNIVHILMKSLTFHYLAFLYVTLYTRRRPAASLPPGKTVNQAATVSPSRLTNTNITFELRL